MKNLFLLPSDSYKNAKLSLFQNKLYLGDVASTALPQNIYIISDEDKHEGDWILHNNKIRKVRINKGLYLTLYEFEHIDVRADVCKKIILTTDQDLIKDGVQSINDDFLNWFINNPTCERVDIEQNWEGNGVMFGFKMGSVSPDGDIKYKIITPKEPTIDDGWLSPMQRFRLREDKPSTTQEPKITLELTQQEARGLLNCLMRTSANGKDLDVGEMVEEKLWEFLKPLESK